MWCLVADKLLRLFSEAGIFTRAYANDVITVIIADNQGIAKDLMRSALSVVEKWCREVQLTVNPEKAEALLFTRKYKTSPASGLKLFGKEIKVSKEANYPGLDTGDVLDSNFNWSRRLEHACGKVTQAYWACRRAFRSTWDLRPDKVRWLYTAVLRLRMVYGAAVRWPLDKI